MGHVTNDVTTINRGDVITFFLFFFLQDFWFTMPYYRRQRRIRVYRPRIVRRPTIRRRYRRRY